MRRNLSGIESRRGRRLVVQWHRIVCAILIWNYSSLFSLFVFVRHFGVWSVDSDSAYISADYVKTSFERWARCAQCASMKINSLLLSFSCHRHREIWVSPIFVYFFAWIERIVNGELMIERNSIRFSEIRNGIVKMQRQQRGVNVEIEVCGILRSAKSSKLWPHRVWICMLMSWRHATAVATRHCDAKKTIRSKVKCANSAERATPMTVNFLLISFICKLRSQNCDTHARSGAVCSFHASCILHTKCGSPQNAHKKETHIDRHRCNERRTYDPATEPTFSCVDLSRKINAN